MGIDERENYISLFEKYQNFLTQTQKQAFELHFLEDISIVEIANILATTRQAINDAIRKSIKKLEEIQNKIIE